MTKDLDGKQKQLLCPKCSNLLQLTFRTDNNIITEICSEHGIISQYNKNGIVIKHREIKNTLSRFIGFSGLWGGVIIASGLWFLLHQYIHWYGRATFFSVITFFFFVLGMAWISNQLGQKWNIQDSEGNDINE